MFPTVVRFATAAATVALVSAGGVRAQSEIQAPDVLVKNVTLEVVDIIQKDKDIQKGDRRKVIALIESKVLPHFNFQAMTASAVGRRQASNIARMPPRDVPIKTAGAISRAVSIEITSESSVATLL